MSTSAVAETQLKKSTNVRTHIKGLRALQTGMGVAGRLLPGPATLVAERLFLTPRRHETPARERAWLQSASLRETEVSGHQVAVYTWGRGRPVVLVHGWEGRATQMGALATAIADAGYRAVAFDAPAHGRSDGRTSSMRLFIDTLQAVAAEEGPLAAVVGHSMGSGACTVALAEGLAAERAVLISSPTHLDNVIANFTRLTGLPQAVQERFRRRMEARHGADIWQRYSPIERAPSIGVPALIVHDRDDDEIPPAEAAQLQSAWPGAALVMTRGLGHRRILRDAEVARAIVAFLTTRGTGADKEESHA